MDSKKIQGHDIQLAFILKPYNNVIYVKKKLLRDL